VNKDRLYQVCVVGDAELVGDGDQNGVGFGDRLVLAKLFHQNVGLGDVAAAEDRPARLAEEADLVGILAARAEIGAVQVINQGDDVAAYRNAGRPRMPASAQAARKLRI